MLGVTLAFLFVIIFRWFSWRRERHAFFQKSNIPGPEPSIFFGNVLEMAKKTPWQCHKEWIQKYGKVLGYYFGATPVLLVADVELLKKIQISDFHKFPNKGRTIRTNPRPSKNERFAHLLTVLRGKRWKDVRSIITPSFTTSKMKMMLPIMDSAVDSLIEIVGKKSQTGESFDIHKLYQGLTMDTIGRTSLGIKTDCQKNPDDLLLRASKTVASGNFQSFLSVLNFSFPELANVWKIFNIYRLTFRNQGRNPITDLSDTIESVIKTRREQNTSGRKDLLQIMIDAGITESELSRIADDQLTAKEDETEKQRKSDIPKESAVQSSKQWRKMTDKEIVDNAMLFFLAGFETTSTTLAFTTHILVHHQDVQQDLREEVKKIIDKEGKLDYASVQQLQYLDRVLMESLRIYPPAYMAVTREAGEDVQYGPYKIKKGQVIQIPVYNIHRDPDLWEHPEKFDPDRFLPENKAKRSPLAFQPFGAGPRNCVGMRFAQLEVKLALAKMLSKYKLLPTENTEKEDIELRTSVATIAPAKGVHLKIVPVE